jgi:hypothetical protein
MVLAFASRYVNNSSREGTGDARGTDKIGGTWNE